MTHVRKCVPHGRKRCCRLLYNAFSIISLLRAPSCGWTGEGGTLKKSYAAREGKILRVLTEEDRREGERGDLAPVNNFKTDPFRHTLGARGFSRAPISLILHASRASYNFFFIIFALCDLIKIYIYVFVFLFLLLQLL